MGESWCIYMVKSRVGRFLASLVSLGNANGISFKPLSLAQVKYTRPLKPVGNPLGRMSTDDPRSGNI